MSYKVHGVVKESNMIMTENNNHKVHVLSSLLSYSSQIPGGVRVLLLFLIYK